MKTIFNTLILIFVSFYALKFLARTFHWQTCLNVMYKARFDCMMLGGIFSVWIVNHQRGNKYFKTIISPTLIFNKYFQSGLFILYVTYFTAAIAKSSLYSDQFLSIITACAIGNLALNPNCIVNIEGKFLSFVGKISFGLYLLHKFPVELMVNASKYLGIENLIVQNIFIYTTSITSALLIAYLSFHYYEAYFLKLKDKKFSSTPASELALETENKDKNNPVLNKQYSSI